MDKSQVLDQLLKQLWENYIHRVHYAQVYVQMVQDAGGRVVNDHIALRSFNTGAGAHEGIAGLERVFLPLDYVKKERYDFASKHLTAYHYEHASDALKPKIFISQLEVDRLPDEAQQMIIDAVKDAPDTLPKDFANIDALVAFFGRPWAPPSRKVVEAVNAHSQYAAWTLLHGHSINHFTAFINEQQTPDYPDLPTTLAALKARGVPMKNEIEGEAGSKLCQSSTQAVDEKCEVMEDDGSIGMIDWSYAYYELAERNDIEIDGVKKQFSGFLGEQATNLFEMTKRG